ncbi:hypothetical protein psyc5s11_03030 [Clostridium gelidum]|uniref:Outer membrane efflux protein n=1 Tax=Clostridium gelidum TaxID=704125 RepID=A0ABN6IU51_9CLOT|nr:TolC family protein [Clostridium gelidum]BCZ44236.1 hypothetical protein psyc5s11_03030 [Clostridium gelidum]
MKKNIKRVVAIGIGLSIMNGNIVQAFAAENNGIKIAQTTVDTTGSTGSNDTNIDKTTVNTNSSVENNNKNIVQTPTDTNSAQIVYTLDNNAKTVSKKPIITLDKIVNAAINNSEKVALKSKEIKLYEDKMKLQDKIDDFYTSIDQKVYDFPNDKLELQKKQTSQSEEFLKDQITTDITNKYNAIILKQMDIEKLNSNFEVKNKELETMKTKVKIGMATDNQLVDKQIEVESLKNDITSKENSLKNNMDFMGVLTDLKLSNYSFDENIKYNVFKINGSVDAYLDEKIDEYLKYNDEMIKLTKDYFKDLKDDGIKDIIDKDAPTMPDKTKFAKSDALGNVSFDTGSYAIALMGYQKDVQNYSNKLTAYGSYLDGKYSLEEGKVKLADSRKNLKNGLKECYSTLLDLQNKINTLNEQVKSTNTKLRYAKSQVDIGMMTENDYKAAVVKSEDLNTGLRQLINTYNTLKDSIQKPWTLSTNQ